MPKKRNENKKVNKSNKRISPNIKFHYILTHIGKKDNHSIGNDKVDKLANEAIKEEIGKIILKNE